MNNKVLVTGGGGFVGQPTLGHLLKRGFEVHSVSRHSLRKPLPQGLFSHQVDLHKPSETKSVLKEIRASYFLHLAWVADQGAYMNSINNKLWAETSLKLLDLFAEMGGKRFVGVGSCAEYEGRPTPYQEDDVPTAVPSLYGTCKDAFRRIAKSWSRWAGIEFAWARLFYMFGPREHSARFFPSMIRPLLKGQKARCVNASLVRDFLFVDDAAHALAQLTANPFLGECNIASGEGRTLGECAAIIGARLGRPDLIEASNNPATIVPNIVIGDTARLSSELGWRPPIGFIEGVERTITWWRDIEGGH